MAFPPNHFSFRRLGYVPGKREAFMNYPIQSSVPLAGYDTPGAAVFEVTFGLFSPNGPGPVWPQGTEFLGVPFNIQTGTIDGNTNYVLALPGGGYAGGHMIRQPGGTVFLLVEGGFQTEEIAVADVSACWQLTGVCRALTEAQMRAWAWRA